ncbi:MAG: SufE family protein [Pseudomonadota bacterium]|jgi:cysteine desulfuration protein SufE|nr:Fe-S cluster assembly protein SufE [Pseudomonadota bacterium]MAP83427.1 Fe-S cluster assembly protein SufE [Gammaproteobacteria bacterium]MBR92833.1 Fe-S cluster assembly protein SufE [Pseudomonadota bacterium]MEC9063906.1 SufE family protein [Pseudomonadota bacterium]MED5269911.1 SufE family protein [Pseudomonadota bacterium]|tara:strand:+ start:162 stop:575 length:414 start_codon:yes stop_codon:yes gene_type:complete
MESLEEIQQSISEEFEIFDTWMEKYEYIIDLGKKLENFPSDQMIDENKVHGCQSSVWFVTSLEDGLFRCKATSDSAIVSGLIALLLRIYDNQKPSEIIETEPKFISMIGLNEHLSPTRNNGLNLMIARIKKDAGMMT